MNDMVLARLAGDARRAAVSGSSDAAEIRLGMPHLSGCGLSETWVLKELGHRHWTMLADAAGRPAPDFRDEEGRFVDRAEWRLDRGSTTPSRRDAFYHANVDPGVPGRVVLVSDRPRIGTRWWHVERADERIPLADVFTRAAAPGPVVRRNV